MYNNINELLKDCLLYTISFSVGIFIITYLLNIPTVVSGEKNIIDEYYIKNFVTNIPCIHWFFNSDKVSKNYFEILKERGDSAKWYNGEKFNLEEWEKLPTLNGTSIRKFEKILEKNNWSNVKWIKRPILTDGRRSKRIFFKSLSFLFYPLVFIKYLDELFMGRICVICKK